VFVVPCELKAEQPYLVNAPRSARVQSPNERGMCIRQQNHGLDDSWLDSWLDS
jgi:hypothetical protein